MIILSSVHSSEIRFLQSMVISVSKYHYQLFDNLDSNLKCTPILGFTKRP